MQPEDNTAENEVPQIGKEKEEAKKNESTEQQQAAAEVATEKASASEEDEKASECTANSKDDELNLQLSEASGAEDGKEAEARPVGEATAEASSSVEAMEID